MKIVLVTHTVYPDFIGGREHHVHHLANALSGQHEVIVIGGGRCRTVVRKDLGRYTLVRLPTYDFYVSRNPLQVIRFAPSLKSELSALRPDILHAFEYGAPTTTASYRYAKKKGIPFFLTVYGYQLVDPFLQLARRFYDIVLGRVLLRGSDFIFCVSETPYREILKITSEPLLNKKITILTNGIPCGEFQDPGLGQGIVDRAPGSDVVNILVAARLLPRKNIATLLKALQLVVGRGTKNVVLSVAGPDCGDLREIRKIVARLRLQKYVRWLGAVPYSQMKDVFHTCDIFVLSSLCEGMPLALLEAMAYGKPVIFSDLPGAGDILINGESGFLIDPTDIASWAKTILLLVGDPSLRKRLGGRAQERARLFDISVEAQRVVEIYSQSSKRLL